VFHLPDLPNAGYATARERQLTDEIMVFMREIERDRLRLLTIVVEGPDKWRRVAGDIWRGLRIDSETVDEIYRYFTLQAAWPTAQRMMIQALDRGDRDRWNAIYRKIMPKIEQQRDRVREMQTRG
jgi:hypothetical protein